MKDKHVTLASEPQEIRISWIEKQKARNAPKRFFRIFVISCKRIWLRRIFSLIKSHFLKS